MHTAVTTKMSVADRESSDGLMQDKANKVDKGNSIITQPAIVKQNCNTLTKKFTDTTI